MEIKKLIFLSLILALLFPAKAFGGDIDLEAGNVRITSTGDGRISVDTRSNSLQVNSYNSRRVRWWQPWTYFNRSHSSINCTNSTYSKSTQTTSINGRVHRSSASTSSCR